MTNIFPERVVDDGGDVRIQGGLTLRDYFAAQALVGLLHRYDILSSSSLADRAYELADAMLESREL